MFEQQLEHLLATAAWSERLFFAFDSLTILISFADVVTDVLVLYEWYVNGQNASFITSLIILILANLSYSIMFWIKLGIYCNDSPCNHFTPKGIIALLLFTIIFPFLLPYIIYFYESPHFFNDTTEYLQRVMNLSDSSKTLPQELLTAIKSMDENFYDLKVKHILNKKLNSHIGFLLETLVESFPQSIIQMITILAYHGSNTNPIANIIIVTSIFLSLISIAFKSILLLAVPDAWTSLFNWTAAVIDFCRHLSWLFLELDDNDYFPSHQPPISIFTIANWIITTIPFYASFLLYLFMILFPPQNGFCCCCMYLMYFIVLSLFTIMGHIFAGIFIAFYLAKFGLSRFYDYKAQDGYSVQQWSKIFRFIHRSSSNEDRLVKVLITNMVIPHMSGPRKGGNTLNYKEWLSRESETGFKNVSGLGFKEWRKYIDRPSLFSQVTFSEYGMNETDYEAMKEWSCSCIADSLQCCISYICLPLYLCGRCVHVLFPIIVYIINVAVYGWYGVFLLHHVLTLTFVVLLGIILGISYKVMYFTYCIYHIGYWITAPTIGSKTYQEVEECYVDNLQLPIICDFFDETFGEDVSRLILMYLKAIQWE